MNVPSRSATSVAQDTAYPVGYDYTHGSPHLRHPELRRTIERSLTEEVGRIRADRGHCRTLEVGAGHGSFTVVLRNAGAEVTVTEMSSASAADLRARFGLDEGVEVIEDIDGSWAFGSVEPFDLVVTISVLHHIPDYLAAVARYTGITRPGGSFVTWQDPQWYPRQPRPALLLSRIAHLSWRVAQGDLAKGIATQIRRFRGVLDEANVSDMSEYHVVRKGVDDLALGALLRANFADVSYLPYWSTQSGLLQRVGSRLGLTGTFGFIARERKATTVLSRLDATATKS